MGWTTPDEVYSAADDNQILKWNLLTNDSQLVTKLPEGVYPTDMHWFPKSAGSKQKGGSDVFALASTDGNTFEILW